MFHMFPLGSCGKLSLVLFIYLANWQLPANGYTLNDTNTLYTNLLQGYIKNVRGQNDQSQATTLSVRFYLASINEFEEITGKFSAVGFFDMVWTDERMIWNPALYNFITSIKYKQLDVWKPTIIVGNPHSSIEVIGFNDMYVIYDNNGMALWRPGDLFEFTCFPDVKYYPYDSQKCEIKFLPWGLSGAEVTFSLLQQDVNLELYKESGTWRVVKTEIEIEYAATGLQILNVVIKLERRHSFYLINMILPICAMGLLNIFVFLLPAESGERVGYSITVLLAIAVFQTMASDNLPKSSYPTVSRLCLKLLIDLCVSCLVMIFTLITLVIYHRDSSRPVPKWCRRITYVFLFRCCKGRRCLTGKKVSDEETLEKTKDPGVGTFCATKKLDLDISSSDDHETSWTDVGRACDIFFASISLIAFICSNIFYIMEIRNAPSLVEQ